MKSYRKELWFNVPGRRAFINITPQVDECLRESGIQEGLCLDNARLTMILDSLPLDSLGVIVSIHPTTQVPGW